MPLIQLRQFTGEFPKLPAHLLPDNAATLAVNCDFAHGDLRPLRGGFLINTMSNAVKSLFTADGLTFFTWPRIVSAVKGPVINDRFRRMYYTDAGNLRVDSIDGTKVNGGEPSNSRKVGVSRPISALATAVQNSEVPNSGKPTVEVKTWFEAGGTRYQEQIASVTNDAGTFRWRFSLPTKDTVTPSITDELNQLKSKQQLSLSGQDGAPEFSPADAARLTELENLAEQFTPEATQVKVQTTITIGKANSTFTITPGGSNFFDAVPGGVEVKFNQLTSVLGEIELEYGVVGTYVFAITQYNNYGEEGQPIVTNALDLRLIDRVRIELMIDRNALFVPVNGVRVYQSTNSGRGYVGVAEKATLDTNLILEIEPFTESPAVLPPLTSQTFALPPDGLANLVAMPNGILAASTGNDVYFCEPYRPHAWPYSMTFPNTVTGLVVTEEQLLVLTNANSYIVAGVHPDAMSQRKLPDIQAGFGSRASAYANGLLTYVSRDGIVAVQGSSSTLEYSQKYFSREDWRNRYNNVFPAISMAAHDGFLIGLNSLNDNGFVFRLDEASGSYSQFRQQADSVFILPITDSVYYSSGNQIFEFQGGSSLELEWQSKDFVLAKHVNFGAAYIRCEGSTTVTILCEDPETKQMVEHYEVVLFGTQHFRLPANRRSLRWAVRFRTSGKVFEFAMAQTMRELQNG